MATISAHAALQIAAGLYGLAFLGSLPPTRYHLLVPVFLFQAILADGLVVFLAGPVFCKTGGVDPACQALAHGFTDRRQEVPAEKANMETDS